MFKIELNCSKFSPCFLHPKQWICVARVFEEITTSQKWYSKVAVRFCLWRFVNIALCFQFLTFSFMFLKRLWAQTAVGVNGLIQGEASRWARFAFTQLGILFVHLGFPCDSAGRESACNVGDLALIPGLRYPGEGKGYPLQFSGLENSMDCIVQFSSVAQWWPTLWDPTESPWGRKESDTTERLSLFTSLCPAWLSFCLLSGIWTSLTQAKLKSNGIHRSPSRMSPGHLNQVPGQTQCRAFQPPWAQEGLGEARFPRAGLNLDLRPDLGCGSLWASLNKYVASGGVSVTVQKWGDRFSGSFSAQLMHSFPRWRAPCCGGSTLDWWCSGWVWASCTDKLCCWEGAALGVDTLWKAPRDPYM